MTISTAQYLVIIPLRLLLLLLPIVIIWYLVWNLNAFLFRNKYKFAANLFLELLLERGLHILIQIYFILVVIFAADAACARLQ